MFQEKKRFRIVIVSLTISFVGRNVVGRRFADLFIQGMFGGRARRTGGHRKVPQAQCGLVIQGESRIVEVWWSAATNSFGRERARPRRESPGGESRCCLAAAQKR